MNKALLDTDIFSEFLKGRDPQVQQNAASYRRAFGPLTISVVTAMEVIKGLHKRLGFGKRPRLKRCRRVKFATHKPPSL